MTTERKEVPALRAIASPGRVHFGIQTYEWSPVEATPLSYEGTPDQVRRIANGLLVAAEHADLIAHSYPTLVPRDDTKAIPATAESILGMDDVEHDPERPGVPD